MLRSGGLNTSITELLHLLEAMQYGIAKFSVENFYYLSRSIMVKDESLFDRFDQIFTAHFSGIEKIINELFKDVPEEWLRKQAQLMLTEEERAQIESMGGFEKLIETLKKRFEEQKDRHQGGSKWIGTAGTSPYGAYGYNPEGFRIGQNERGQGKAVKVWDKREFRDFDDKKEIDTRGMQVALKKLRQWSRIGFNEELDINDTISYTAKNGFLDVKTKPEKENSIKILLFLDVGGSMDEHVYKVESLFSAAKSSFKHLKHFYFHFLFLRP